MPLGRELCAAFGPDLPQVDGLVALGQLGEFLGAEDARDPKRAIDAVLGGGPNDITEASSPSFLVSERSVPYSIIVDANGERFTNESESNVDLGHHMREHAEQVPGKYWMISDVRHARRFLRSYAVDPRATKAMRAAGIMHQAKSLSELAGKIGVDANRFRAAIDRFNGFARTGIDEDFGRGNSAYDRYYGDPMSHPNPNLGTTEKGLFTAVEIVAGDLGTQGGVLTNTQAQVLRDDGSVIEGLYASGNCSASVMGRTYPGPGSTLGPAVVFGYLAARHLAGKE